MVTDSVAPSILTAFANTIPSLILQEVAVETAKTVAVTNAIVELPCGFTVLQGVVTGAFSGLLTGAMFGCPEAGCVTGGIVGGLASATPTIKHETTWKTITEVSHETQVSVLPGLLMGPAMGAAVAALSCGRGLIDGRMSKEVALEETLGGARRGFALTAPSSAFLWLLSYGARNSGTAAVQQACKLGLANAVPILQGVSGTVNVGLGLYSLVRSRTELERSNAKMGMAMSGIQCGLGVGGYFLFPQLGLSSVLGSVALPFAGLVLALGITKLIDLWKQHKEAEAERAYRQDMLKVARMLFGFPAEFTHSEVRARYRLLASYTHPDKNCQDTRQCFERVDWAKDQLMAAARPTEDLDQERSIFLRLFERFVDLFSDWHGLRREVLALENH